jgi:hypothetical protein
MTRWARPSQDSEDGADVSRRRPRAAPRRLPGEKDTKLAQKLGQLQPSIAVLSQEGMGQLASFGPTRRPSRSAARDRGPRRRPARRARRREKQIGGSGGSLEPPGPSP